jgi:HK97 gp10 family phage protein
MAVRYAFKLSGLEEYLEKIQQAGVDIDEAVDRALVAGAGVILAGMKKRVPKRTGNLESHLTMTEPRRDGNVHYIDLGLLGADAKTARYGMVQEYGSTHDQAQPYIRSSFDMDKAAARRAERESLKQDGMI